TGRQQLPLVPSPALAFLTASHSPPRAIQPIRTNGAARMTLQVPPPGTADIGLVGLAVMGQNLVLNMADHGFKVAVYNRTTAVTQKSVAESPPSVFGNTGGALVPAAELKDFARSIKRPRRVVILVKAGAPTDAVIDSLVPVLEQGDCIIDGGNAEWTDT